MVFEKRAPPVTSCKPKGPDFIQIKRRESRPRRDGALGGGVVLRRAHGPHRRPVAVAQVEHLAGDVGPAGGVSGAGEVVGAVGSLGFQQVEDGPRHVAGEGQAADLVVHHGHLVEPVVRVGAAVGEPRHGPHEVVAVAYHPGAAQDVVLRARGDGEVAGGLGLAVDRERAQGLVLRVDLPRAVEDVVRAYVHEHDAVLGAGLGEQRRAGRVRPPGGDAALLGLRPVDGGVGAAVDHRAV